MDAELNSNPQQLAARRNSQHAVGSLLLRLLPLTAGTTANELRQR